MLNNSTNIASTLARLKQEYSQESQKMAMQKLQIDRIKREITVKQQDLARLEGEYLMTDRLHKEHDREIKQAADDLRKTELDSAREHSSVRHF